VFEQVKQKLKGGWPWLIVGVLLGFAGGDPAVVEVCETVVRFVLGSAGLGVE
jgi:hypothetical protein